MKRIIALIIGALFAVFSNLSPILPKSEEYIADGYYKVSEGEVNYKEVYEQYAHNVSVARTSCDKTPRYPDSITSRLVAPSGLYWIQLKETDSTVVAALMQIASEVSGASAEQLLAGISYTLTPKKKEELIAPCDLKVDTSPSSTDSVNGTLRGTAVLDDGHTYRFSFVNMYCWYCCINKEGSDENITTHVGSNYLEKNDIVSGGTVIGLADTDTTFEVEYLTEEGTWSKLDDSEIDMLFNNGTIFN